MNELENNIKKDVISENVCDLSYLSEMVGGKKQMIKEIMDVFLKQIAEELQSINDAIAKSDYLVIKKYAHTMRSTVSIMSISVLAPILTEMEALGAGASNIEKIKQLNVELNSICNRAIGEIVKERHNYA